MTVKRHGVHFDITAQDAASRAMQSVENSLKRVNAAGDAVSRTLAGAFVATAAISGIRAVVTAAMEAEQAGKRVDAVLKATGGTAKLTKDQLDDMADSLAESTQFDDEGLRDAQAMLLKFGNIHSGVFERTLKLSADLAAFMGSDVATAAQAVGKAISAPSEALGSLEKQIGKFNPAAEQMIKSLVEQGRVAEAQAAVLDVLQGKIGGTAEAMNSGLTQSVRNVSKSWGEMLEAIGKTSTVGGSANSVLVVVDNYLRNIKDTIENGDWVEKALAVAALVGGAGGHRRFNLSKADEGNRTAADKITGLPGGTLDDELAGFPMSEADVKNWKEFLRLQEEAKRKGAEAAEKARRELDEHMRLQGEVAERERKIWDEAGEATQEYYKKIGEQNAQLADDQKKMWEQIFETIDREQEEAIEQGAILLDHLKDKVDDIGKELGLTFTSAFEDAVLESKKWGDVVKGIIKDIGRMILRETVTKPIGGAIQEGIKGFDLGGIFKGILGGGGSSSSSGAGNDAIMGDFLGSFDKGTDYLPRDGFAYVHKGEAIVPASQNARGGVSIGYVDMRGASVEAVARLERFVSQLNGSIEARALGVMRSAAVRGAG